MNLSWERPITITIFNIDAYYWIDILYDDDADDGDDDDGGNGVGGGGGGDAVHCKISFANINNASFAHMNKHVSHKIYMRHELIWNYFDRNLF